MSKILVSICLVLAALSSVNSQSWIPTAPTVATSPTPFCPPDEIVNRPTDHCAFFIVCIFGQEHLAQCPDGFLFDVNTLNCQDARLVDCGTRPIN
jgi:hypothetical protein